MSAGAVYIGVQDWGKYGKLVLFNITGDHPMAGNTVSEKTLLAQGIPVPDYPRI